MKKQMFKQQYGSLSRDLKTVIGIIISQNSQCNLTISLKEWKKKLHQQMQDLDQIKEH
jgi:hypothetical protein